jgi:hypothetical protein
MASLLVQAYPAVPDALAVASAVIADMNEKGQPLPGGLANLQGQGLAGMPRAAQKVQQRHCIKGPVVINLG